MLRASLVILSGLILAGCSSDINRAKDALEESMVITTDLEFHDLRTYPGNVVCGAYSGYISYSEPRQLQQHFLYIDGKLDKSPAAADEWFYCSDDQSQALHEATGIGPFTGDSEALINITRDMTQLVEGLEEYYRDNFYYPTAAQGLHSLVEKPTLGREPRAYRDGGYLDAVPQDPWGKDYLYEEEQWGRTKGHFSITTLGASAEPGGAGAEADISSLNLPYLQHLARLLGVD